MTRVAIHAHVFYANIWSEICACIGNIVSVCGKDNVFVVITFPDVAVEVSEVLADFNPGCRFRVAKVPNRGYDIGPFLFEFLNKIDLVKYDLVVKLHTKRDVDRIWVNFKPFEGAAWRQALCFFCASRGAVERMVNSFSKYSELGMVAHHRVINYSGSDCEEVAREVRDLISRDYDMTTRHLVTVSGSIFCVRASLLRVVQNKYNTGNFSLAGVGARAHKDYGLAGRLEFLFSMIVDAQGFIVSEGRHSMPVTKLGYVAQIVIYRMLRLMSKLLRGILGDVRINRILVALQGHKAE